MADLFQGYSKCAIVPRFRLENGQFDQITTCGEKRVVEVYRRIKPNRIRVFIIINRGPVEFEKPRECKSTGNDFTDKDGARYTGFKCKGRSEMDDLFD